MFFHIWLLVFDLQTVALTCVVHAVVCFLACYRRLRDCKQPVITMVGSEDPRLNQGGVDLQNRQTAKPKGNGGSTRRSESA